MAGVTTVEAERSAHKGPWLFLFSVDPHCTHPSQVPLNSAQLTERQCLSRLSMCVIEIIEN